MEKSTKADRRAVLKHLLCKRKRNFQIGFVVLLILFIGTMFLWVVKSNQSVSEQTVGQLKQRDSLVQLAVFSNEISEKAELSNNVAVKKNQKEKQTQVKGVSPIKRLRQQYDIIDKMKQNYLTMAKYYYEYSYAFDLFFAILSVLSAFLGFLVLKNGWEGTKSFYLKSAFLVVAFYSSLFGVLPEALNNKENIKNNLDKYNYFNGLQFDIYDLTSDNKGFLKRNTAASLDSLNAQISLINKSIKENQEMYFDTQMDAVPDNIKILDK